MTGRVAAVVPAAGRGDRLGGGTAKALRQLRGEPLLVHAVRALLVAAEVVVVAAPPADARAVVEFLRPVVGPDVLLIVTPGGETRRESVRRCLRELPDDVDVVLVHDAARPLVPAGVVHAVVAAVRAGRDAVVPVLELADTVKQVGDDGRVLRTLARTDLRAVQTPQGFRPALLLDAHARASGDATDDAALVEELGCPVWTVPGADEAVKVTRPLDLVLAEAILAARGG